MLKVDLLNFIETLTLSTLDRDILVGYLDDTLEEMAQNTETICDFELVPCAAETKTYTLAAHQFRLLQAFYDSRELIPTAMAALEYRKDWRVEEGPALAIVAENETESTYRLFPVPQTTNGDFNWIYGEPFGMDFPDDALTVVFTLIQDNTHDIPNWLALIIAYLVAAKVFSRSSVYQDMELAGAFKLFGDLLMRKARVQ